MLPSRSGILAEAINTKILSENHPDFPHSHPDSPHSHHDSPIPTPIPRIHTLIPPIPTPIPRIPTLISRILTLIPRVPPLILRVPNLIPRVPILTLILFPYSSFRLLQIATYVNTWICFSLRKSVNG